MKAPSKLVVLLTLLIAAGCGASVNAQLKASIDGRVANMSNGTTDHGAPTSEQPPPLVVGQWVQHRSVNEDGENAFTTQKIVGEQGNAYWIETVSESYYGTSIMLMLVTLGDRTDPEQIEVHRLLMKTDDDDVQEQPPGLLGLMSSMWRPALANMNVSWSSLPQEDVSTPAGHFPQTFRRQVTVSLGLSSRTSDSWMHPSVPINGVVRSVGVDYQGSMEVVAFGNDARSDIGVPAQ